MAKYLYNSIELPALPEWDKTAYPYAVIYHSPFNTGSTAFYVDFLAEKPEIITTVNGDFVRYSDREVDYVSYFFSTVNEEYSSWTFSRQGTHESICKSSLLVWTNADIYYADDYSTDETLAGTVYLAASDPIPVAEPIDPTSFMQGYIVGRRLAGMRLKLLDDNIDIELIDGILYIKNAKAILTNGILEVK